MSDSRTVPSSVLPGLDLTVLAAFLKRSGIAVQGDLYGRLSPAAGPISPIWSVTTGTDGYFAALPWVMCSRPRTTCGVSTGQLPR